MSLITYRCDEILLVPKVKYRPQPIPYGTIDVKELTRKHFEGYPQIIKQEGSKPVYDKIKTEKDIYVAVDGVRIAVDIYRPDVEGEKFPALVSWGLWGKDNQEVVFWLREHPQPYYHSPLWDGTLEGGDFPYLVSMGYAVVVPDPRGVGKSEGDPVSDLIDELHNPNDMYDLIEWAAKQTWCNGNVGMIGPSSYAFSQLLVAQNPPPSLKAICPIEAWYPLGETNFTGMFDMTLMGIFHGGHIYDSTAPIARWGEPKSLKQLPREELEKRLKELLEHSDIKYNPKIRTVLKYHRDPIFFDAIINWLHPQPPLGGLERIEIPVYVGACRGGGARIYYHAAFEVFDKARSKYKKLMFLSPGKFARPWVECHDEVIRWHDYWLKGIDTGILDEPPIKVFVTGINKWKFENEWPPARVQWTRFYTSPEGLVPEPPATEGFETLTQPAPYEDPAVYALPCQSKPLEGDLEVMGWVAFYLEASIDKQDVSWFVDLIDIYPDGTKQFVSEGWLRALFKTIDETKSKLWLPMYKIQDPIPITPGREVYAIRMSPAAHVFKKGNCIGVIIRTKEDLFGRLQRAGVILLPHMERVTANIHFGPNTYILLPITGKGDIAGK